MEKELQDSIASALLKRVSNPLLGTFSLFWIVCHWQFFVVLFFVDENKILLTTGMLKNEYLSELLFNFLDLKVIALWLLPFLLTWLMIWKLPKWVLIPALAQEEDYRLQKRLMRIESDKKVKIHETELAKEEIENLEVRSQKKVKEQEIQKIDPKTGWEEEFEEFKKLPLYQHFNTIILCIYGHNGKTEDYADNEWFIVPKEILAYCHTSGLIEFTNNNEQITLTEKGKFFVNNFIHKK